MEVWNFLISGKDKLPQILFHKAFKILILLIVEEPISLQEPIVNSSTFYVIVSLIEKGSGTKIQEYSGHSIGQFGVDVVFNTKDTHVMTGSVDGKLYIYDLMRQQPIKMIQGHKKVLSAIGIHEVGGLVTASHDGTVCYWKIWMIIW